MHRTKNIAMLDFPWVMLVLQSTNSGMGAGVSAAIALAIVAGKPERANPLVFHAFLLSAIPTLTYGLGVSRGQFGNMSAAKGPIPLAWVARKMT